MIFLQIQVSKIVHITRSKWYTETDLEQVGDLDSNIHQSCCQRLCTLNQPVCNNEWEHTVTIVELNYNLLQYLLFHHVLFCKCFSYVLLSIPLQLHSSVQKKKIQNTLSMMNVWNGSITMQLTAVIDCHPWMLITLPIIPSPPMEDKDSETDSITWWCHFIVEEEHVNTKDLKNTISCMY